MAKAAEVPSAAEYTYLLKAAAIDAMCAMSTNLAHASTTIATDYAMSAQVYPGNTGNLHLRKCSETSRDAYEDARSFSNYVAPFANPLGAPKARWAFDPHNGAALRAPLDLFIPKSQWNFSPYTGLALPPSPRQSAPKTANTRRVNKIINTSHSKHHALSLSTRRPTVPLPRCQPPAPHTRRRVVAISPHLSHSHPMEFAPPNKATLSNPADCRQQYTGSVLLNAEPLNSTPKYRLIIPLSTRR